jgi:hypothetical protein
VSAPHQTKIIIDDESYPKQHTFKLIFHHNTTEHEDISHIVESELESGQIIFKF